MLQCCCIEIWCNSHVA